MTGPVPSPRRRAFSLVEIAIALGISSFAIITLLGLLAVGLGAGKDSHDDIFVASMAQSVLSGLKTNAFSQLPGYSNSSYFTREGMETNRPAAYYRCDATARATTAARFPLPGAGGLVQLQLRFAWPAAAAQPNVQIFQTGIASY